MPESSPDAAAQAADNSITTDETAVENNGSQDVGSESSTTTQAGSMLDAVQAALEPKAESPAASNPDKPADGQSDAEKAQGEAQDEELSDAELKALSWKAQQRFKKLASAAKTKDGEIADLKVKADEHDRMVTAVAKAGLQPKQVDELIELGSHLLTRPDLALQKLEPLVNALREVVGEVLPADLAEEVRLGYITEARAKELNKARATASLETQARERQARETEAEQQQREAQAIINSSITAVEAWEKQQAGSDPDFPLKQKEVSELVELAIIRETKSRKQAWFPNAEESVKLCKDALKTVNERISRFKPRPTEVRPHGDSSASTRSKAAPKTILDAINNAL